MIEKVVLPKWSDFELKNSKNMSEFVTLMNIEDYKNFPYSKLEQFGKLSFESYLVLRDELILRGYQFVEENDVAKDIPTQYLFITDENIKYITVYYTFRMEFKCKNISNFRIEDIKFFNFISIEGISNVCNISKERVIGILRKNDMYSSVLEG